MTTHDGPLRTRERTIFTNLSHEVAGTSYVGGAGERLYDLLHTSWQDEADELCRDLVEIVAYLGPQDAGMILGRLISLVQQVLPPEVARQLDQVLGALGQSAATAPVDGSWTYDGSTGGAVRPYTDPGDVPPPPVVADAPAAAQPPILADSQPAEDRLAAVEYLAGAERFEAGEKPARPAKARGTAKKAASGG